MSKKYDFPFPEGFGRQAHLRNIFSMEGTYRADDINEIRGSYFFRKIKNDQTEVTFTYALRVKSNLFEIKESTFDFNEETGKTSPEKASISHGLFNPKKDLNGFINQMQEAENAIYQRLEAQCENPEDDLSEEVNLGEFLLEDDESRFHFELSDTMHYLVAEKIFERGEVRRNAVLRFVNSTTRNTVTSTEITLTPTGTGH